MKLKELLKGLEVISVQGNKEQKISAVAYDSKKVEKGSLFACLRGYRLDGHTFISEAIERGATALLTEGGRMDRRDIAYVVVPDTRLALARISDNFYEHPSGRIKVIGVTGTNGKTTTTYLTESILKAAGYRVGLVGTINYRWGERILPAGNTTPQSVDLQRMLSEMVKAKCNYAVLEVSSHSLDQHRVDFIEFDVAVFTNLSLDHLDYHHSLSHYLKAKTKLFRQLREEGVKKEGKISLINIDDRYRRHLLKVAPDKVLTYGIRRRADIRASQISSSLPGLSFQADTPAGSFPVKMKLMGTSNVYNALAAIGVGISQGIKLDSIKEGLETAPGIPGRFELIDCGQDFTVMVDYAHTPSALEGLLRMAKGMARGKIITVFGCGGDRDRSKRPLMGKLSSRYSHLSILTSDNPRSEEPGKIISEIRRGFGRTVKQYWPKVGRGNYLVVEDRFQAIKEALARARKDDVVIIAGKGHESYQVLKDTVVAFDDREVVRRILAGR
ncbi:UDP-N-acetylmuramoyl-L-alanyl-D-glutamate--2,6-diaminopimelate ligase [candidate division NPL-UPA2 bacterium]|nr:UDP-N-acetylmuramoyl-L-alanyl-D-glutamate--2,6-diaminopimelate ligase [candidate division NPL-UPA2 bacterium]